jgi:hypothetical protein
MELVQQQRPNTLQRRVLLQPTQQDALCHDFDPGGSAHAALQAHPVAHAAPDRLAQQ